MTEIIDAVRDWFTHPEFDPSTSVIWDFGDAFLDVASEEFGQAYELVRNAVPSKRTGGKTAWVHWSLMVEAFILEVRDEFDWGSEWKIFQSIDDAFQWCQNAE